MSSPPLTSSPTSAPAAPAVPAAASLQGHDTGLLLLRLAVGMTIAAHGCQKLFGWFGGGGLDATGQGFTAMGYPSGESMALVAGLSETLGGAGLTLGLITPLAATAVLGTMANAVVAVHWDDGFFSPEGIEYPMVLGLGAASLALTGPGRYAADRLLPVPVLREHRLAHGLAAVVLALVASAVVLLIKG